MMPVLASTLDQSVESMVPWVVSGFLDETERVVMRRKEVVQTLSIINQKKKVTLPSFRKRVERGCEQYGGMLEGRWGGVCLQHAQTKNHIQAHLDPLRHLQPMDQWLR